MGERLKQNRKVEPLVGTSAPKFGTAQCFKKICKLLDSLKTIFSSRFVLSVSSHKDDQYIADDFYQNATELLL